MKRVLVLGASLNEHRYSNMAIRKLVNHGYDVVGIGSKSGKVAGQTVITDKPVFEDIHTITLYLNPDNQRSYYDFILSVKPQRIIFNPGSENKELEEILSKNAIPFEKACTLVMLSLKQF